MALSHPMIVFSLFLTFLALSAAQSPMASPPMSMMAPTMPPSTMAMPPTTPPPMSIMSPPPSIMLSPPMAPSMDSPPTPAAPGMTPGPMDGGSMAPSSGFVHGSSMAMVAIIGSVALLF